MLLKTLPRIAARILRNTHVGQSKMKEKFLLIAEAYGTAAVEKDFETWCHEQVMAGINPRYPMTEYVKVIDSRLGAGFSEPSLSQFDLKDPNVAQITSKTYEETGCLPPARSVATLLKEYPVEEIMGALVEFCTTLDEKDRKSGVRQFFAEGGATAVIYARRKRK